MKERKKMWKNHDGNCTGASLEGPGEGVAQQADCVDWIGLEWVGVGWIGVQWGCIGVDWIGVDWSPAARGPHLRVHARG